MEKEKVMVKNIKYDKLLFEGEYLNGKKWNGKAYYVGFLNDNKCLGERI